MNNHTLWGLLALSILLTPSCKEGQELIKRFKNQSDATLEVQVVNNYLDLTHTFTIGPGETRDLSTGGGNDGKVFADYSCLWEIDHIQIGVADGRNLVKDPNDLDNWTYEARGGDSDRVHLCVFLIQQKDVQ